MPPTGGELVDEREISAQCAACGRGRVAGNRDYDESCVGLLPDGDARVAVVGG